MRRQVVLPLERVCWKQHAQTLRQTGGVHVDRGHVLRAHVEFPDGQHHEVPHVDSVDQGFSHDP